MYLIRFKMLDKGDINTLNFGIPRRQAHSTTSPPARSEFKKGEIKSFVQEIRAVNLT